MKKETIPTTVKREFTRFRIVGTGLLILLIAIQIGLFYGISWFLQEPFIDWLPATIISSLILVVAGLTFIFFGDGLGTRVQTQTVKTVHTELSQLRAANNRFRSLQAMASTLRATLSFERVVESALQVCSLTLEEMGVPSRSLVGAVFLYSRDQLQIVASRNFITRDLDKEIAGEAGIIGQALKQAEPVATRNPRNDPELQNLVTLQSCKMAICIPLRAGFQIFGAMLIATQVPVEFTDDHLELFNSVADQAVIALQNAKFFQDLKAEKQRIVEADEAARKELARDLHDGPTQSIAAIAMRVNFIRSLVNRDPEQAMSELDKVEKLARETSKEIRGMLFTLRPLVLETEGLTPAIETLIKRLQETDNLNIRLVGGENGNLLDEKAQSMVFSIIEEALGNARKYSKAKTIEVRLWREEDLFVSRIQDDGVGFDVQGVNANYSSRGSLGMVNMRERAERINGSLRVESAPGKGTTITLVVPLEKHGRPGRSDSREQNQRVQMNR